MKENDRQSTKPMRILHVIGKMDCGGAETLLVNILKQIDRAIYHFDFVVHDTNVGFYDEEIKGLGCRIYAAPHFKGYNITEYVRFWDKFFEDNGDYDVVHGHIGSSAAFYLYSAKKHGIKTIAHSHNTNSTKFSFCDLAYSLFAFPTRYVADFYMGCSLDAGIDRYGMKIAKSNKFLVMNNGIDAAKYQYNEKTRNHVRANMGLDDNVMVFGHVGRFSEQKNHLFLIDVFEKILSVSSNSELWLFGKGDQEDRIHEKVKQLGLEHAVRFFGVTDKVPEYLQAMDVFIFPSVFEGLGIALVEAQAAGLPCIVSNAIVPEADLGANLITKLDLSEDTVTWAQAALSQSGTRKNAFQSVVESGFDICETVKALTDIYQILCSGERI